MEILKKYDAYVANPSGRHNFMPEELITFFSFNFFSQKHFVDISRCRDDSEEELGQLMEKLKTAVYEAMTVKQPGFRSLLFPIMRFFFTDFNLWLGSFYYEVEKTKDSIDFMEEFYVELKFIINNTGNYR